MRATSEPGFVFPSREDIPDICRVALVLSAIPNPFVVFLDDPEEDLNLIQKTIVEDMYSRASHISELILAGVSISIPLHLDVLEQQYRAFCQARDPEKNLTEVHLDAQEGGYSSVKVPCRSLIVDQDLVPVPFQAWSYSGDITLFGFVSRAFAFPLSYPFRRFFELWNPELVHRGAPSYLW